MHALALFAAIALVSPRSALPVVVPREGEVASRHPDISLPVDSKTPASPVAAAGLPEHGKADLSALGDPRPQFKDLATPTSVPRDSLQTVGVVLLVLGLAVAALLLRRRKKGSTRHIQILETAAIGQKRSLVLVSVGKQALLLSCCDAGITLLSTQPTSPEMLAAADRAAAGLEGPALAALPFPKQLADAEESQGLRRLLAEAGVAR